MTDAVLYDVSAYLPRCGSCCQCPLQTAVLGVHRAQAPGPAPDWPCCCLGCAVSGEAIVSSAGCTSSGPQLCPRLLHDPACM